MSIILPGQTIGIVGGGQLGRMLAIAAAQLGYKTHIFTPEADSPASHVATHTTIALYDDMNAIKAFAQAVDLVTFEFENIPHDSLMALEAIVPVRPTPELLKISQNRLREKNFINANDIATAPYHRISNENDISRALEKIGFPAILKTTELGYDGKGQARVESEQQLLNAWAQLGKIECVLEGVIDFTIEISVIVARGEGGQQACYIPVQNIHKHHILDRTIAPAPLPKELSKKAQHIAMHLAQAAKLQGLLAVEMFVTKDGAILVNELAPRPHNSGHWTMDACVTGQFEQLIRAVCGLPLGGTERLCDAEMHNLIGEDVEKWRDYAKQPHAKIHLYGKATMRSGRKMGHVNILKA